MGPTGDKFPRSGDVGNGGRGRSERSERSSAAACLLPMTKSVLPDGQDASVVAYAKLAGDADGDAVLFRNLGHLLGVTVVVGRNAIRGDAGVDEGLADHLGTLLRQEQVALGGTRELVSITGQGDDSLGILVHDSDDVIDLGDLGRIDDILVDREVHILDSGTGLRTGSLGSSLLSSELLGGSLLGSGLLGSEALEGGLLGSSLLSGGLCGSGGSSLSGGSLSSGEGGSATLGSTEGELQAGQGSQLIVEIDDTAEEGPCVTDLGVEVVRQDVVCKLEGKSQAIGQTDVGTQTEAAAEGKHGAVPQPVLLSEVGLHSLSLLVVETGIETQAGKEVRIEETVVFVLAEEVAQIEHGVQVELAEVELVLIVIEGPRTLTFPSGKLSTETEHRSELIAEVQRSTGREEVIGVGLTGGQGNTALGTEIPAREELICSLGESTHAKQSKRKSQENFLHNY